MEESSHHIETGSSPSSSAAAAVATLKLASNSSLLSSMAAAAQTTQMTPRHHQQQQTTPISEAASPITEFYKNKSILVTGSTGFIGKVLIEKLLYSCPNIDKIYLLIRSNNGKSPQKRMLDMIQEKPFNMRLKFENIKHKLVAIDSDLSKRQLGLSQQDQSLLIDDVSIIFHVAASVKFEAPLEVNMRHNVMATRELLEFASTFKQLACFIHVSTAYSNCQLRQIDERIYKMDVPEDPMSLKVTQDMLENRPNTYTYTKAMAENVANQYASRMNVVIVRPSIVMSSMREPTEGWVDTINGPVGLSVLGALGILQKIKVNSEVVFDLIPVDIVTNALVSIAWAATEQKAQFFATPQQTTPKPVEAAPTTTTVTTSPATIFKPSSAPSKKVDENGNSIETKTTTTPNQTTSELSNGADHPLRLRKSARTRSSSQSGDIDSINSNSAPTQDNGDSEACVFNLTTGSENPCSFYHYFSIGREEAYRNPSTRALRPLLKIPKQKGMNPIQYWMHKILTHLLFAYLIDFILSLVGQKRMVVKAVNRMHHANEVFDYFCSNQWTFNTDNVKRLRSLQSDEDRDNYNCDVRTIDWNSYAKIGWLGCRRFILKEQDETTNYARLRYKAVCLIYYFSKILLLLALTTLSSYFIESRLVLTMCMLPTYSIVYLL